MHSLREFVCCATPEMQSNNYERWHYVTEHDARHESQSLAAINASRRLLCANGAARVEPAKPAARAGDGVTIACARDPSGPGVTPVAVAMQTQRRSD